MYLNFKKSNSIVATWFVYEKIKNFIVKVLGLGFYDVRIVSGFEIELFVVSKKVYPIIFFLNKHSLCVLKTMVDIICYDTLGKSFRFFLVYNLLSTQYNIRFRLITKINELVRLVSLVSLFKSSSWSEREVFDFFGIFFFCNKDLRRILTDYGFKGFPLRKDFPLMGYIDVYYDDNQKCICYKSLELSQEYRNFNFSSNWKVI